MTSLPKKTISLKTRVVKSPTAYSVELCVGYEIFSMLGTPGITDKDNIHAKEEKKRLDKALKELIKGEVSWREL